MRIVEPKIIRLAQTTLYEPGLEQLLLATVGLGPDLTRSLLPYYLDYDAAGEVNGEILIELAGRLCYRSFAPGLNPNVTKIREGRAEYVRNLLRQKHFSVLEHINVTYAFLNVSRVFTHELVRHRIAAFSQESLRYVRLTDLGAYYPEAFGRETLEEIAEKIEVEPSEREQWIANRLRVSEATFRDFFNQAERAQYLLAEIFALDSLPSDFSLKKRVTSAMRRCAPIGLTTAIIMTANLREWRHVIELRTSDAAEEEIRKVIGHVRDDLITLYPNALADLRGAERDEQ